MGPGNRYPERYKEVWTLANLSPNLTPCTRQAASPQAHATITCPPHSPRDQRPYAKPQGVLHSTVMSLEARWSLIICGSVPRQATPPWPGRRGGRQARGSGTHATPLLPHAAADRVRREAAATSSLR